MFQRDSKRRKIASNVFRQQLLYRVSSLHYFVTLLVTATKIGATSVDNLITQSRHHLREHVNVVHEHLDMAVLQNDRGASHYKWTENKLSYK